MIEAICWDVGGVFSGRPIDAVGRVAADHGLPVDTVFAAVFGPYHLDGDHVWHRLERGEVSLAEAWPQVESAVAELGIDLSLADFFRRFGEDGTDRAIVSETLVELHDRGIAMAVITNNVAEFGSGENGGWRSLLPMERIDVVVDSSAVGVRKPDPAIYLHALAELGAPAERVAFVDDMEANVEAARAVGMRGVVMGADPAAAMEELRALVDDPEDVTPR